MAGWDRKDAAGSPPPLSVAMGLTALAGIALFLMVERPAIAAEPASAPASDIAAQVSFDLAFDEFAMDAREAAPSQATILAAEQRFTAAPVEAAKPKQNRRTAGQAIRNGNASYYGARFAGRRTANGEIFNPSKLTAAHRTLPFGTRLKVTNKRNGRSVIVRVNDRGPFHGNRVIDLSREAAKRIGLLHRGHGPVELARLSS